MKWMQAFFREKTGYFFLGFVLGFVLAIMIIGFMTSLHGPGPILPYS